MRKLGIAWFNFKQNFAWNMKLIVTLFGVLCSVASIVISVYLFVTG